MPIIIIIKNYEVQNKMKSHNLNPFTSAFS